jgi:hypothetical protein
MAEMKHMNSLVEDTANKLHLPIDKVPLFPLSCDEQPLSLIERYRLRSAVENAKIRKRVQHFSEFIKKFPECGADLAVPEKALNITKKINVRN